MADRIPEMLEILAAAMQETKEQRLREMTQYYEQNKQTYKKDMQEIFWRLLQENAAMKSIVICYLRSSFITRSHQFFIAAYSEQIFLEEDPPYICYSVNYPPPKGSGLVTAQSF